MKPFVLTVLLAACLFVMADATGSTPNNDDKQQEKPSEQTFLRFPSDVTRLPRGKAEDFSLASNQFGVDMLKYFGGKNDAKTGDRDNILFSPYSLAVTMAMVHQGSTGNSAEELKKALHFDQSERLQKSLVSAAESVQDVGKKMHESMKGTSTKLEWGNLMLVNHNFTVKQCFSEKLTNYFDGKMETADFSQNEQVKTLVNDYVSAKTNGLIKKMLVEAPDKDTQLALINTVYFKGSWDKPFSEDKTETGVFYGSNGRQYPGVSFMRKQNNFLTAQMPEQKAKLIILPYERNDVAFVGILPTETNADLKLIRDSLNATYIDKLIDGASLTKLELFLPRMELETSYDLKEPLQALGINEIWTRESRLTEISGQSLMLGKALHKAKMIVNEKGTEAAAGSFLNMVLGAGLMKPPVYRFDHPFIYLIRHRATGQILFVGEVNRF